MHLVHLSALPLTGIVILSSSLRNDHKTTIVYLVYVKHFEILIWSPKGWFVTMNTTIYAKKGMVATSQPLAAEVGLEILKKGGNAVDAAIATAACLTVVEPTANGIGGDAFAIVWLNGELHGLNASGPAPKSISIENVRAQGHETMPTFGWLPVTVPGQPAAWATLAKRFGKLPLTETLQPAIKIAEEGYLVTPVVAKYWQRTYDLYSTKMDKTEFAEWYRIFAPNGRAPKVGEIMKFPDHAKTLAEIAKTNAASFYHGELAAKIVAESQKKSGYLQAIDLAEYAPEWVTPLSVNYRGYDVWELPPNGQGIIALSALNILKHFDFSTAEPATIIHQQIEALKLAFTAGKNAISDPETTDFNQVTKLLSSDFALSQAKTITDQAANPEPTDLAKGGTVYLATADTAGNMVSYIQSNYMGFGSGVVIPNTGIAMQNRGADFSLDPTHANALTGGKKTYHTIIPGFLTKDGQAVGPFGVMGGYLQPQGHVQLLVNTIDFKLPPQAALDAPRFHWVEKKTVELEAEYPTELTAQLTKKGHDIQALNDKSFFGRGQIIWRNPETGELAGGTEKRTDGHIAAY